MIMQEAGDCNPTQVNCSQVNWKKKKKNSMMHNLSLCCSNIKVFGHLHGVCKREWYKPSAKMYFSLFGSVTQLSWSHAVRHTTFLTTEQLILSRSSPRQLLLTSFSVPLLTLLESHSTWQWRVSLMSYWNGFCCFIEWLHWIKKASCSCYQI